MSQSKRPIIVIKKKGGHGGHHGGAWKVAYADFVTAMMALFIVLWLTSSGEKVRKSIAGYFNDPLGTAKLQGTDKSGEGDSLPLDKKEISELKDRIAQQIAKRPDLKKLSDQVEIIITPEGLRIELMESRDGTFFETGSSVLNATGKELLTLLAKELGSVQNRLSIEGHTDAQRYASDAKYDNWELSTDRANSARRLMQTVGLHVGQLSQVRGFADQQLRVPKNPLDPSNRRVSVIVHYLDPIVSAPTGDDKGEGNAAPEKAASGGGGGGAKAGESQEASGKSESGTRSGNAKSAGGAAKEPAAGKASAEASGTGKSEADNKAVNGDKSTEAAKKSSTDVEPASQKDAKSTATVAVSASGIKGLVQKLPTTKSATALFSRMTPSFLGHKAAAK